MIVDRGYRHWEGERLGIGAVRWAIVVDTLRRAFGLGRRARAKLLPWGLMALAVMVAAVVSGVYVLIGVVGIPAPPEVLEFLPDHADLFGWYDLLTVVFVAVVGPSMLIPERRHGTLSLALSRPLELHDWLLAKAAAFTMVMATMLLSPHITLWLGRSTITDGMFTYIGDTWPVLWQAPLVALAAIVALGGLLAVVASVANRTSVVAVAFLGTWAVLGPVASELSQVDVPGLNLLAMLHLSQHVDIITNLVFDRPQGITAMRSAGFAPWVSVVVLTVFGTVSAWFTVRRHGRLT